MADTAPAGLQMDGTVNTQVAGNNPGTLNTGPALANGQHQETFTPTPGAFAAAKPTSSVVTTSGAAQATVDNTGQNISTAGSTNVLGTPASTSGGTPAPAGAGTAGGFTWSDGSTGHMVADTGQFGQPDYNANSDPNVPGLADQQKSGADQQAALAQQQKDELATLQQNNATDTSQLASTNAAEQATQTSRLGSMGALAFASGNSYLAGLQQSHEQSMQILQQKYQQTVTAAIDAYNNNNFALSDKLTTEANNLKKNAQDRNTALLNEQDKVVTQKLAADKQAFTEANDAKVAAAALNKTNIDFARSNGLYPDVPFFESGGQIYNAADGSSAGSTADQLKAAGVAPDMSNVQQITAARPGVLGQMDAENATLVAEGKTPYTPVTYAAKIKQDNVDIAAAGRAPTQASQDQSTWQGFTTTDLGNNGVNPSLNGVTLTQLLNAIPSLKSGKSILAQNGDVLVGSDGNLDPAVAKQIRDTMAINNPRLLPKLDSTLAPHLSNSARLIVGIGKYSSYPPAQ